MTGAQEQLRRLKLEAEADDLEKLLEKQGPGSIYDSTSSSSGSSEKVPDEAIEKAPSQDSQDVDGDAWISVDVI